uniref:C-type lectin domain-containing protein n=2 Tax=Clytia hemisphaerica TaxID=252671 RepID=A0A7M5WST1_9CNID
MLIGMAELRVLCLFIQLFLLEFSLKVFGQSEFCDQLPAPYLCLEQTPPTPGSELYYVDRSSDSRMPKTHQAAQGSCGNMFPGTGNLFIPETAAENAAVREQLPVFEPAFWIGMRAPSLSSPVMQDQFKWSDGSDVTFDNWANNNPVDDINKECVVLVNAAGWKNVDCDDLNLYICRFTPAPAPPPPPPPTETLLRELNNLLDNVIIFEAQPDSELDYQEAHDFCKARNAVLGKILNVQENKIVSNSLASFGTMWIGLLNDLENAKFKWKDGNKSAYRRWCSGQQPTNMAGCVVFRMDNLVNGQGCFDVVSCDMKFFFYCERRSNDADNFNSLTQILQGRLEEISQRC